MQSGKVARSGEEKASRGPAPTPTIEPAEKFRGKSIVAEKFAAAWQPCNCCTAQFYQIDYILMSGGPTGATNRGN
ncbi:MAG: hypothetical protein E5W03_14130 [Mesorhizobium sp.]|nr:MAG: hypothetical protein E5W03_14130 [Mesorhizobium sp.]